MSTTRDPVSRAARMPAGRPWGERMVVMAVAEEQAAAWRAFVDEVAALLGVSSHVVGRPAASAGEGEQATLAAAASADAPVLVLPSALPGGAGPVTRVRRVLVPVDRSAGERRTLRPLLERLQAMGSAVEQLHVLSSGTRPAMWEGPGHHAEAWHAEVRRRHQVGAAGFEVKSGEPAAEITARAGTADLVVLCWRSDPAADRARTLRAVLQQVGQPVLLLPLPKARLRLPPEARACLFDLDGVLTSTASVHAQAWKATFDELLAARARRQGIPFVPFDEVHDYLDHVDGKPREEGARDFLASRGIHLPDGSPDDPPGRETVWGIAGAKNERLLALLERDGVRPFPGSVRFVEAAKAAGIRTAVVSSSANARRVLAACGLDHLVDAVLDGDDIRSRHLDGKPAPDTFLAAAHDLGVAPAEAVVFEDAQAGVEAGRRGGFLLVVGVDRGGQRRALQAHGADVVVGDLAELLEA